MAGFNPSFRIQGQVYHLIGSIVPTQGESPKFAQIYFIDEESEVATRSAIINGSKPDIIRRGINQLLHQTNHYVELFKVAKEIFDKKTLPLMLGLLLMKQKGPQVNTPGGTTDLLVMRMVY